MGKIKQGVLGGFSGKVGPVTGTSWKGKAVIKARALSYNNPNTEEQQKIRRRFALIGKFIAVNNNYISIGFADMSVGITAQNAAMSVNFENGVGGTWPNYELAYNNIIVSTGKVDLPYNPSASVDSNTLSLSWSDNSGEGNAKSTDEVMVLVYNSTKGQSVYSINVATRSERTASVSIPTAWNGDSAEVYLSMHRPDGGETSKSFYLGNFTI